MNKAELVEEVATVAGLEKRQAEAAVAAFVDSVVTKTKAGEPVSVFGFGTFKPTARAARTGRNPQTGAAVKIAASKGVKFQPATGFKKTLNTRGAAKKTATRAATSKAAASKSTVTKTATRGTAKTAAAKTTASKGTARGSAKKTTVASKAPATRKVTATAKRATTVVAKAPATRRVSTGAKKAGRSVKKR